MTASAPTAAWPTYALRDALARAGWGDLDGRAGGGLRACLSAAVSLCDWRTGRGKITARQIATAAGITERWARRCLAILEDLGLIIWSRGWLDQGNPRPGRLTIVKRALATMIRTARHTAADRRTAAQAATRSRLQRLRNPATTIPPRAKPVATSAELSTYQPPLKGGPPQGPPPERTAMPARKLTPMRPDCVHGIPVAYGVPCEWCKRSTGDRHAPPPGWFARVRERLRNPDPTQPDLPIT